MMGNQGDVIYGIAVSSSSLLFAMLILSGFLVLAILVSMMRIYKKAGKTSISAIIPIWSQIVLLQIVGKPAWYIVLLLVPIVNIVIMFQTYILLAKKFGKGTGFGVGMVLLPMIFIPLLSFYDYEGNEEKKEEPIYNPFNETNVTQVMPSAPIENNNVNEVSVNPISVEIQQTVEQSNENQNVSVATDVNEVVEEVKVEDVASINNEVTPTNDIPVSEEVSIPEAIPVVEPISDAPVIEQITDPVPEVGPTIVNENPSVQDIETILNNNSTNEPQNIAFGATPMVDPVNLESLKNETDKVDTLEIDNLNVSEETNNVNFVTEEAIEMPEKAAKTCPACGVSLVDDVKFCTSCGTQI